MIFKSFHCFGDFSKDIFLSGREDSCKLFCQTHTSGVSYQLKEKVEDGTPCGPETYDICVSGKCRVAGCDYVLNSTLKDGEILWQANI